MFKSIGHAFAWVFKHIIPAAQAVEKGAQVAVAAAQSPLAQALASLDPAVGQQVLNDVLAVAGAVTNAAGTTAVAVAAKGLDISADEGAVQALERLVQTVGGLFGKKTAAPTT